MIDIKFLRENPDVVRASQKGRGEDVAIVDKVLAIDDIRRAALAQFETLRAEQNILSKSIGAAKGDEKAATKLQHLKVRQAIAAKRAAGEEVFTDDELEAAGLSAP